MDSESNNLFQGGTKQVFDVDAHTEKAINQTSKFWDAGVKALQSKGVYDDHPAFADLINLYINTAERAYHASLSAFTGGVPQN